MQSQPTLTSSHQGINALCFFQVFKDRNSSFGSKAKRQRATSNEHAVVWIPGAGGGERDRTDDLLLAKQALSQLSYTPDRIRWWVWMDSNHRPPPYQDGALTN